MFKRKFHPDEDYWRHTMALPNHGVYGRTLNMASASHKFVKPVAHEDSWQSTLFFNPIWHSLLWCE